MEGKKCFAVCPSDTAIALTALGASVQIVGPNGTRTEAVQSFFKTLGNVLDPGEMVTEIRVPRPPATAKQTFLKFTLRKPIDFAIVSVAAILTVESGICQEARIALGAVAPMPISATQAEQKIVGRPIDERAAAEAADAAVAGARPLSMNAYKVEQTRALVRRAILA